MSESCFEKWKKYKKERHCRRNLPAVLLVLAAVLLICAQCRRLSGEQTTEYPVTRVSVILPHNDDGYWTLIKNGIEEAEQEIGKAYNIDVQIFIPQLNYNIEQMIDILRQQIAAKTDVIAVQGNEDERFREVLEEARSKGTRVICIDTPIREFSYDLYIGTDNRAAGELMGRKLGELCGGAGRVAVLSGEPGYLNLEERYEGMKSVLEEEYPQIELTGTYYTYYDGLTFMNLYHNLSEEADILACLEGTGGITLSHTYQTPDHTYQYMVAFDSREGVENGVLDGVVMQDTHQIGRKLIEELAAYVRDGRFESRTIYTNYYWFEREKDSL